MSVISPVSASGAAAVPVIVAIATGERPDALQFAGMAAAFAGVFLATRVQGRRRTAAARRGPRAQRGGGAGLRRLLRRHGRRDRRADPFWALLVARSAAGSPCSSCSPASARGSAATRASALAGPDRPARRQRQRRFTLGADTGLLSVVAVLASLYPVGTVLLARALLGERLVAIQAVGVCVALAGVALIAAG